ncbi:MAG: toll/interleukin-1 receptor domain-containing protein [Clostridia bacterium]|nr:toll/interleukin-1 receptor domain-containing protein [Clostridia bacterium]
MNVYEGTEKYVFVSYAHNDSDRVIPLISAMQKSGLRVWYDSGIKAGTEWPAYIESHINRSEVVLVCMSPSAVASVNCRNEINYACMLKKDILVVYLEKTTLAQGMNLQLTSLQSMFRYRHSSEESFTKELLSARILAPCREHAPSDIPTASVNQTVTENAPTVSEKEQSLRRTAGGPALIATVGSLPSQKTDDPWPATVSTKKVDVCKYNALYFHARLIRAARTEGEHTVSLQIFNAYGALVFETVQTILFRVGNDRFSIGWILRDTYGLTYPEGGYTALVRMDDSQAMAYDFELASNVVETKTNDAPHASGERAVSYAAMLLVALLSNVAFFAAMSVENAMLLLALLLVSLALRILLTGMTRHRVTRHIVLAILLVFLLGNVYDITLLVLTITSLIRKTDAR